MIVGDVSIEVVLIGASDELRSTPASERTQSQIRELRDLADAMISLVRASLGVGEVLPISAVQTSSGAVIVGLVTDPVTGRAIAVPVEHVILIRGGGLLLMVAGSEGADPARVAGDGVLEISRGGVVSVLAYGLSPGVEGEVVVMSTPRLIGQFTVSASGGATAQAQLPDDLGVGSHTVVVTVGDEAASLGFRIVDEDSRSTLPVTGPDLDLIINWSLALLTAGVQMAAMRRRGLWRL
jgi:hypothetical protein